MTLIQINDIFSFLVKIRYFTIFIKIIKLYKKLIFIIFHFFVVNTNKCHFSHFSIKNQHLTIFKKIRKLNKNTNVYSFFTFFYYHRKIEFLSFFEKIFTNFIKFIKNLKIRIFTHFSLSSRYHR